MPLTRQFGWCEGTDRRRIERRTIPALLEGVPADQAADMRTTCRAHMKLALEVAANSKLFQAVAKDSSFTGLELSSRRDLAGCQVAEQISSHRGIVGDITADDVECLA